MEARPEASGVRLGGNLGAVLTICVWSVQVTSSFAPWFPCLHGGVDMGTFHGEEPPRAALQGAHGGSLSRGMRKPRPFLRCPGVTTLKVWILEGRGDRQGTGGCGNRWTFQLSWLPTPAKAPQAAVVPDTLLLPGPPSSAHWSPGHNGCWQAEGLLRMGHKGGSPRRARGPGLLVQFKGYLRVSTELSSLGQQCAVQTETRSECRLCQFPWCKYSHHSQVHH